MKTKLKSNIGFTMLDVLLIVVLGAGIAALATVAVLTSVRGQVSISTKGEKATQIFELWAQIEDVGRIADNCKIPAPGILECYTPRTDAASPSTVRWEFKNSTVEFQVKAQAFETKLVTRDIAAFQVCDGAMFEADTCPIESKALGKTHAKVYKDNGGTVPDTRYFRFRIASADVATADQPKGRVFETQGAFFTRNAPGFTYRYMWGIRF